MEQYYCDECKECSKRFMDIVCVYNLKKEKLIADLEQILTRKALCKNMCGKCNDQDYVYKVSTTMDNLVEHRILKDPESPI